MTTDTIVCVCLIIITAALLILIGAMVYVLMEVRRLSKLTDKLMTQLGKGVNPVLSMLDRVSADAAVIIHTLRSQVERIDLTADHVSKRLIALADTYTKTGYLLHDAVTEPLVDMVAFLKGMSRVVTFLFDVKKR